MLSRAPLKMVYAWNVIGPLSNIGMKPHLSIAEVIVDILNFVKYFDAFFFSFNKERAMFQPIF